MTMTVSPKNSIFDRLANTPTHACLNKRNNKKAVITSKSIVDSIGDTNGVGMIDNRSISKNKAVEKIDKRLRTKPTRIKGGSVEKKCISQLIVKRSITQPARSRPNRHMEAKRPHKHEKSNSIIIQPQRRKALDSNGIETLSGIQSIENITQCQKVTEGSITQPGTPSSYSSLPSHNSKLIPSEKSSNLSISKTPSITNRYIAENSSDLDSIDNYSKIMETTERNNLLALEEKPKRTNMLRSQAKHQNSRETPMEECVIRNTKHDSMTSISLIDCSRLSFSEYSFLESKQQNTIEMPRQDFLTGSAWSTENNISTSTSLIGSLLSFSESSFTDTSSSSLPSVVAFLRRSLEKDGNSGEMPSQQSSMRSSSLLSLDEFHPDRRNSLLASISSLPSKCVPSPVQSQCDLIHEPVNTLQSSIVPRPLVVSTSDEAIESDRDKSTSDTSLQLDQMQNNFKSLVCQYFSQVSSVSSKGNTRVNSDFHSYSSSMLPLYLGRETQNVSMEGPFPTNDAISEDIDQLLQKPLKRHLELKRLARDNKNL